LLTALNAVLKKYYAKIKDDFKYSSVNYGIPNFLGNAVFMVPFP
jgi:hypothetical protein